MSAILGLGPAVFLIAGALAVGPAGRISDRVGRMPVIRFGFGLGIAGPAVTALGCWFLSGPLVFLGLGLCGASQAIVLLSRAAAAEMFPPDFRARGMSFVLFGAVSGAIWGPLVFGPIFAGRALTPHELAGPWLGTSLFALAGLAISFFVRPDPKELSKRYRTEAPGEPDAPPAPLAEIVRRPGVAIAMMAAVASFAVMVGVMNLAGVRRRRPRPQPRRRLHRDQRAHRRHVRPRARRRRPDREDRPRPLDDARPRADGGLERRA